MMFCRAVRARLRRAADDGFTLVELLVASAIGIVLGGLVLSTILVGQRSGNSTTTAASLDGEARVLLNRLAGDLRQATPVWTTDAVTGIKTETPAVTDVQNPEPYGSSGQLTSITFDADFSGDGCIDSVPSDGVGCSPAAALDPNSPEVETFCWDPATKVVYLIAGGVQAGTCTPSTAGVSAQPLLSGNVENMEISCYSNRYLYDGQYDGVHDGVTDWRELDHAGAPVGNGDGLLDGAEQDYLNSIRISVTVAEGDHTQTDQTLVFVRNVS